MLDKYFPLYIFVFLVSLSVSALTQKRLIPRLRKNAAQPIYTDGPAWHTAKSGTPTMGGIAFLIGAAVAFIPTVIFFFANGDHYTAISVLISLAYSLANSTIGVLDDVKKLKRKENQGLTASQKIFCQIIAAAAFLFLRNYFLGDTTEMSFSFGTVDFGIFYYPLALVALLGIVNCANLTDGIDGLASSVAFSIGVSLFYLSAALNVESSIISAAIIGISVGFLIFNIHPAKIFMGDTGSLFFGAIISSCVFALRNPLLIIFIAGVYVIEGGSVILQVAYYKMTKKRIFKMAPLHHHLEKCGYSENKICIIAIIATFIFSIPAYLLYLP